MIGTLPTKIIPIEYLALRSKANNALDDYWHYTNLSLLCKYEWNKYNDNPPPPDESDGWAKIGGEWIRITSDGVGYGEFDRET